MTVTRASSSSVTAATLAKASVDKPLTMNPAVARKLGDKLEKLAQSDPDKALRLIRHATNLFEQGALKVSGSHIQGGGVNGLHTIVGKAIDVLETNPDMNNVPSQPILAR